MATISTLGDRRAESQLNPVGRLGWAVWRTLTNVKFAVLQIAVLCVAGVIGAVLKQLPTAALHDPAGYAQQMAIIHQAYDPLTFLGINVGPTMVDVFERLGFFEIFASAWFVFLLTLLCVSIIVCTINRVPDMWRKERLVRVVQAPPFFDMRLDNRATIGTIGEDNLADVRHLLRKSRFHVREERVAEPAGVDVINIYGDKNQYFRLATLFTHLGLILFLGAAALTTAFGFETVVFLGNGQTAPVQPVGTPDNLLVKNINFEAPMNPDGTFADFSTDLAVYQNGVEVARKTIHVNDPLDFDGYVFHQNTFGPAEDMVIRDSSGALLWQGPVLLDGELAGEPQGFMTIPGSEIGLLVVLEQTDSGATVLAVTGLTQTPQPDGTNIAFLDGLSVGQTSAPSDTGGYTVTWTDSTAYTGMVIKRDPGQGLVWIAYGSLITGLILTFYFPRRRFWARYEGGRLQMAMLADRYVNTEREFGKLVESMSARFGVEPAISGESTET